MTLEGSQVELITFDAEGTLVCYRRGMDDGKQYARAYDVFSDAPPEVVSQWPKDSLGSKWLDAYHHETQRWRGANSGGVHPHVRPWMSASGAVTFFSALSRTFLELCGMPMLARHSDYVRFLMYDWYMSDSVYRLPDKGTNGLEQIVAQFPLMPMFVVSNTDSRIREVVQLFPAYNRVFRGRVLTACDVDFLKPSADGILTAAKLSGVLDPSPVACSKDSSNGATAPKFWLHVGDSLKDDGGASTTVDSHLQPSGRRCLFMRCDPTAGVDFDHLLKVVSSASPVDTLLELGYHQQHPFVAP